MPTPQLIEEDIAEIDNALQELLIKSDAGVSFLIDKAGFVITHSGRFDELDMMTLAALSAASFAATESIAALVSEKNFSSVYQQGENFSLLVLNVDEQSLITVIFKATLSVGAIKFYATETIKRIATQLKKAHDRSPDGGFDLSELNMADPSSLFRRQVV
jgi:predicted regulator of Ras-like GTPase activity (Roadblock/LC7/MglB family)